ncbi:MAG TPA: GMP/IMP nucleotidase [Gammaproteobacteria bacterium]|nr:GMP/IMP nucleotidase [Gammaproteobacteria bacterium]
MCKKSIKNTLIPPWADIDTVLLDMDGTLLDLHFDTHFWLEHVPIRYAEANNLSLEQARKQLMIRYHQAEGRLEWYCVDYWSDQLKLDIETLKQEVGHLISVRPDVISFLQSLGNTGKHRVLVTNAHGKSLSLKMKRTPIGEYLDEIITAHDIGLPKEHDDFWYRLQQQLPFSPSHTLLIDDSVNVLQSAEKYGIKYLRAILQPNSKLNPEPHDRYIHIDRFADIVPFSD